MRGAAVSSHSTVSDGVSALSLPKPGTCSSPLSLGEETESWGSETHGMCNHLPALRSPQSWTSLVVQWLRLHASTTRATGSIPSWGTKIPHFVCHDQEINLLKEIHKK